MGGHQRCVVLGEEEAVLWRKRPNFRFLGVTREGAPGRTIVASLRLWADSRVLISRCGSRVGRACDVSTGRIVAIGDGIDIMARKEALDSLHQILTTRREAIRMALTGDLSLLNELASQATGDVVDWALDSAQDELSSQLAEVEARELGMIDTALKRMASGEYGMCEACENPIPMARLQALPYATMCVQCQRESELRGSGTGPSADWSRIIDFPTDEVRTRGVDVHVR